MTTVQEQVLLTQLKAHLDDIVNHAFPAAGPGKHARPAFTMYGGQPFAQSP